MKDRLSQSGTTLVTSGVLSDEKSPGYGDNVKESSAMPNTQQLTRLVFLFSKQLFVTTET